MSQTADTIPVRPEEAIDEQKLAEYLHGKLTGSDRPLAVRQFPGGKANLTYHLDYGSHEYVLRRPPLGPVAPGAHDMEREYSVLSVLHQAFPKAPKAFLFENNTDIVGAPFFIMERRHGLVVRSEMPDEFSKMNNAGARMSMALVDTLADLHRVDYQRLGLETLGKTEGFIERQIEGWYKRWTAAKYQEIPDMEALYSWLKSNLPDSSHHALVHNDYKLDNAMFSFENPDELVAIFDWDMCTLGDPLSDLGSLLCYWTDPEDPPFFKSVPMMPLNASFLSRNQLAARYAEKSGRDISRISFYHILGLFRLAGIAAQIYIRYVRGQTRDKRFAFFGEAIPLIARFALDISRRE